MLGKVEICGVNTAELKVLSSDACRALLIRAKHGDRDAREQLIAGNLRLVLSVIQKFTGRGESADDLFQVGCIGLIKAIDNFDAENHDVRFSTYGVPMISGEIRRYLRDNSPIRVSRSTRDTAYQVLQEKERLTAATGREPSLDEIANRSVCRGRQWYLRSMRSAIPSPSTNRSTPIAARASASWTRSATQKYRRAVARAAGALERNGHAQRTREKILSLRFYAGKTQMEVAGEIGISQAQVSRLEKQAIGKIRGSVFPS